LIPSLFTPAVPSLDFIRYVLDRDNDDDDDDDVCMMVINNID
jgi:hypothetical protein